MADAVANAKFVEIHGDDHLFWVGDSDTIVEEAEHCLTGARHAAEPTRVLPTVMFTDMVESTSRAAQLRDARCRALTSAHDPPRRAGWTRYLGRDTDLTTG